MTSLTSKLYFLYTNILKYRYFKKNGFYNFNNKLKNKIIVITAPTLLTFSWFSIIQSSLTQNLHKQKWQLLYYTTLCFD